ncbi:MAG: cyclic-di-AMP receptor [Oscillospiraceae bacterium]
MKLITAIVSKDDATAVQTGLTGNGFSVTRLATTGGFLQTGNVTFMIAVDDESVDEAIGVISEQSCERKQFVPATATYGMGIANSYPLELTVGGAIVFVQNIERFEKL